MTEDAPKPEEEPLELDEEALERVPPPRPRDDEILETEPIEEPAPAPVKPIEIRDHSGEPLNGTGDFFAEAPSEIGPVLTARSSLAKGKQPTPAGVRAALSAGSCLALAVVVFAIFHGSLDVPELAIISVGAGALAGLLVWYLTRFAHMVSYVGKAGVARIYCRGTRSDITKRELFLFEDAQEVRTSQTRQYVNGVYSGTNYAFRWTGSRGVVFQLTGTHRGETKPPAAKDAFHFAASAEVAWSVHLLDRIDEELRKTGSIQFNLDKGNFVRVGPRFMEFGFGGQLARCDAADVKGVSIDRGTFTVQRKDAKIGWFSKTGVFSFGYGSMANAKLFLLALDKLMGVRFR